MGDVSNMLNGAVQDTVDAGVVMVMAEGNYNADACFESLVM